MSPSPLTDAQLAELRRELERVLTRLERSLRATEEAARPVELDQTAVGRLSRMDSLQNQGLTRTLKEREQARLSLLHDAFERLEAGSYGICTGCGAAIDSSASWSSPRPRSAAAAGAERPSALPRPLLETAAARSTMFQETRSGPSIVSRN